MFCKKPWFWPSKYGGFLQISPEPILLDGFWGNCEPDTINGSFNKILLKKKQTCFTYDPQYFLTVAGFELLLSTVSLKFGPFQRHDFSPSVHICCTVVAEQPRKLSHDPSLHTMDTMETRPNKVKSTAGCMPVKTQSPTQG